MLRYKLIFNFMNLYSENKKKFTKEKSFYMKRMLQMSETLQVAVFLALSGGLMDAYSYMLRGKVFANAQTGNMLLLGVYASKENLDMCIKYAFPIFSFTIGILLAQFIRMKNIKKLHWRQASLIVEVVLLIIVGFLPESKNQLANALTSLSCGIQVQTFRKLYGSGFSTTMCIGNLRSGTHKILDYFYSRKKEDLKMALYYFFIIICFVIGAIIGSKLSVYFKLRTIWVSPCLLLISILFMFIEKKKV